MYIIVDKLVSFDRFSVKKYEDTSYYIYGKSIIDIPDKLGFYLLHILNRSGYSKSIKDDMDYLSIAIYILFNDVRKYYRDILKMPFEEQLKNTQFDLNIYYCIEEFFNTYDFEGLYKYPHLYWIQVCSYIQQKFLKYYLTSKWKFNYV